MTKTRKKEVVVTGVTRDQMEEAFGAFALADAKCQGLTAKMDAEITKIREKYSAELTEQQKNREEAFGILRTFATENRADLFTAKKSMETTHGILGFRTGNPQIKQVKGFTVAASVNLLREFAPEYIRTKEEAAKDKFIADRENEGMDELMTKVGLYIDQDETFYVEPKKEE
jgi:phage host-nuclease inhibitor protein Gam